MSVKRIVAIVLVSIVQITAGIAQTVKKPLSISGIYPSLAYFNKEGECGTGAVVPWADRLWVITYGPHMPFGSSDKLYEITPDLKQIVRPESIGGTPANRLIHKESNQLFIGPYVIDDKRNVRVIPIKDAPGRLTAMARSPFDPEHKVIIGTMEAGFYEIDTKSLEVNTLFKDGNQLKKEGLKPTYHSGLLLGAHGKGLYSSQGVIVFGNNGETGADKSPNQRVPAGSLSEWDGKNWKLIRRNQFAEVTGPGSVYGNEKSTDPIWAVGWDYKSVILALRDNGNWSFYRLPKASNTYDAATGWNTEWPRIRNVGDTDKPNYLMTMHGMFWHFPKTYHANNTAGIRPGTSYLKVMGDFTKWNNQLVFGCDDAAQSEFLNKREALGGIAGPGQSQSNLWFTDLNKPDNNGTANATGAVWLQESVKANETSEPFLFSGWENKTGWLKNDGDKQVDFTLEVDKIGNNNWSKLKTVTLPAKSAQMLSFLPTEKGEWIRVKSSGETKVDASFVYSNNDKRQPVSDAIFNGLATINSQESVGGLLYSLGKDRRSLGIVATQTTNGNTVENGYYEMDGNMKISPKKDSSTLNFIKKRLAIPTKVLTVEAGSYLIVDDLKRRWRLPLGNDAYKTYMDKAEVRICREVATERDLFSVGGTFYELPAENADGYAKIRPIATHNFKINDYVSYRGLLVMTGLESNPKKNEHIFQSEDKKCSVWAGAIDDLWKLGKPTGHGGPWINTEVVANTPSDAYLFSTYDSKTLTLSHSSNESVKFTIEFDPTGDNSWINYKTVTVKAKEKLVIQFPKSVLARWIRFETDKAVNATSWLEYK